MRWIVALAVVMLAIVAGSAAALTPTPRPTAERLRIGWWGDVGYPTPFRISVTGPGGAVLLTLLYDTLTWKDDRAIIPWLAQRWEIGPDGRTYRFFLDPSARWHDGRPLRAADVAFSFATYARFPYRWQSSEVVERATAIGDGEVEIRLRRPLASFLEEIAGVVPILPRHVWEAVGDPTRYEGEDATIGSGPYRLVEYRPSEGLYRLAANGNYFKGRPRVGEILQLVVAPQVGPTAVQKGQLDLALSTDATVEQVFGDDLRVGVHATPPQSVVRLVLNTTRPPLDRRAVRQAIAYGLDRAKLAEVLTKGPPVTEGTGVLPPESPWYNSDLPRYAHDPERARRLLGGERLTVELLADPAAREPELLAPMLEAVGIQTIVQRADARTRAQRLRSGDYHMALTGHIGIGGDPDFLRRWAAGEEANDFAQGFTFRDPAFARAAEEQAATLDPERRRALVWRLQAALAEELPTIVLYHRRFYWVYDRQRFAPFATYGGLLNGVPFPTNKLTFLR